MRTLVQTVGEFRIYKWTTGKIDVMVWSGNKEVVLASFPGWDPDAMEQARLWCIDRSLSS